MPKNTSAAATSPVSVGSSHGVAAGNPEAYHEQRADAGGDGAQGLGRPGPARQQAAQHRHEQADAQQRIEHGHRLHDRAQVDRQDHAQRAAQHGRGARHPQQFGVARLRLEVTLVDVLRHRRRDHEEDGVARVDLGGEHRGQRQRAEPRRQQQLQHGRQHQVRARPAPAAPRAPAMPSSTGTNAKSISPTALSPTPIFSARALAAPYDF